MVRMDLNADVGERPDALADGREEALLRQLTSANIACGGHAGDAASMDALVRLAARHGIAAGAHPGYPDRANFGRAVMEIPPDRLRASIREQVAALAEAAGRHGVRLAHVKPHGALYNAAVNDPALAGLIAAAVAAAAPGAILVGLAGSAMLDAWRVAGFAVAAEAFADRRYEPDGTLRPRQFSDALITDPDEASAQALSIARDGRVTAWDGTAVPVRADTLCVHSDTPGAAEAIAAIRRSFRTHGILLAPLSAPADSPPDS
jgi:5-oxoprolinase (ATP-hydrolysing) subunit A